MLISSYGGSCCTPLMYVCRPDFNIFPLLTFSDRMKHEELLQKFTVTELHTLKLIFILCFSEQREQKNAVSLILWQSCFVRWNSAEKDGRCAAVRWSITILQEGLCYSSECLDMDHEREVKKINMIHLNENKYWRGPDWYVRKLRAAMVATIYFYSVISRSRKNHSIITE